MKIVLIKLGALGDVIRTLPLARAIKKKFPDSELTWITKTNAKEIIETDENIDHTVTVKPEQEFDILYNFDIDEQAMSLASEIPAKQKFGFYSESGYPAAFNAGAEYYLNTLFDDELKKSNKKTYQEMMFEAAELPYEKRPFKINLSEQEIQKGRDYLKPNEKKLIGIHIGSSSRWPSKAWHQENIKNLVIELHKAGHSPIIFAGPEEVKKKKKLIADLKAEGIEIKSNNSNNTIREFASLVNSCDAIVCNDSLALHIATGLNKPSIGLFFCTSPHEVEPYENLTKISSPRLEEFFPEKMDQYDEGLVRSISVSEVLGKLKNHI